MSALTTSPMTQLSFAWHTSEPTTSVIAPTNIRLGVPAPAVRKDSRRGKPEHISDLLLVVLDRYGIDPQEFMAGLESN